MNNKRYHDSTVIKLNDLLAKFSSNYDRDFI